MQHPRLRRAYVPCRFGQLHVRIAEPEAVPVAPPLVCFHQTPSHGGDWDAVLALMSRDRWVIAPDTPGYGQSDAPPEPASVEELAAALSEGLEVLAADVGFALTRYDAMGHHTGSVLAAELARYDGRVRHLVFCSLPAFGDAARQDMLGGIDGMFPPVDGSLARAEQLHAFQSSFADRRLDGAQRQVAMAECLRTGERMDWGYRAVFDYDLIAVLSALPHRALILNSEDDLNAVTGEAAQLLERGIYRELEGCGHGFLAFADEDFADDVRGFLDGH
ncbi:alpha/beta fold hydrolase [Novosphingobium mangrovi (ex Hu et al. 2023)]|uniref:Alpha/beta hydrolase n=1 Tax=Novosphingobium mangrovi (ex Hu et al. 2023) TaxID=2930094 RepID=A0ABT0AFD1_9SPHN|nr:alpha/beta fold hydrolase [Novosphingobium mangrovi (ex Hu et al. 2023)]MCJ1961886.1 alpha/beta hydrolase [Novosphingobium mangrovi (ex Hu et al. 2023)]